jgi:hypothetical protein
MIMCRSIDVMIAGAQKAGTTSLASYLAEHPELVGNQQREMAYFSAEMLYTQGYRAAFDRYYPDGVEEDQKVLAKNVDIMSSTVAMRRLYDHNPACKIIVVLRDPVERAYSAFWYARRVGREPEAEFEAALEASRNRVADLDSFAFGDYLERGLYAQQIKRLSRQFGDPQLKVILLEDLQDAPQEAMAALFQFIDVNPSFQPAMKQRSNPRKVARSDAVAWSLRRLIKSRHPVKVFLREHVPHSWARAIRSALEWINEKQAHTPPMSQDVRADLSQYYREPNRELEEIIDRDLSHWT